MKILKKTVKYIFFLFGIVITYSLITILLSCITVNENSNNDNDDKTIYLSSNGIHLSIIIPKKNVSSAVLNGLHYQQNNNYFMFGWGNEDFYLNTPTWSDLKFKYVFRALFLNTPTAIHVATYQNKQQKWIAIQCNKHELNKLNTYILETFKTNSNEKKQLIPQNLYGKNDFFYKANGSYSTIRTCNTWANDAFKQSGLKASYFTIFDFGLLNKYNAKTVLK